MYICGRHWHTHTTITGRDGSRVASRSRVPAAPAGAAPHVVPRRASGSARSSRGPAMRTTAAGRPTSEIGEVTHPTLPPPNTYSGARGARGVAPSCAKRLGALDEPLTTPSESREQFELRLGHLDVLLLAGLVVVAEEMQHAVHHQDLRASAGHT